MLLRLDTGEDLHFHCPIRMCCILAKGSTLGMRTLPKCSGSLQKISKDPGLPMEILARDAAYLSFPNHLDRLDTFDHCLCGRRSSGTFHGSKRTLNVAMVGFDSAVTVRAGTLAAAVR